MERVAQGARTGQLEVVGYTVSLKTILGVGSFLGEETPAVEKLLKEQAKALKKRLFQDDWPRAEAIYAAIDDGTLMDFRDRHQMVGLKEKYPHSIEFRMEFEGYLNQLAYHYHFKRDVLQLATSHGVLVSANPKSKDIKYPLEALIVPKEAGRQAVDGFLAGLRTHMGEKYGIDTAPPECVPEPRARVLMWSQLEDPKSCLIYPEDWQRNLAQQSPPDTDDIRAVREFFNRWYVSQPHIQKDVLDAMLKGPQTTVTSFRGIQAVHRETPQQVIRDLTAPRI